MNNDPGLVTAGPAQHACTYCAHTVDRDSGTLLSCTVMHAADRGHFNPD